jgi:hypothetical protein
MTMPQENSQDSAQPEMLPEGYTVSDDELRELQTKKTPATQPPAPEADHSTGIEQHNTRRGSSPGCLAGIGVVLFGLGAVMYLGERIEAVFRQAPWTPSMWISSLLALAGVLLFLAAVVHGLNAEHRRR